MKTSAAALYEHKVGITFPRVLNTTICAFSCYECKLKFRFFPGKLRSWRIYKQRYFYDQRHRKEELPWMREFRVSLLWFLQNVVTRQNAHAFPRCWRVEDYRMSYSYNCARDISAWYTHESPKYQYFYFLFHLITRQCAEIFPGIWEFTDYWHDFREG